MIPCQGMLNKFIICMLKSVMVVYTNIKMKNILTADNYYKYCAKWVRKQYDDCLKIWPYLYLILRSLKSSSGGKSLKIIFRGRC